MMLLDGHQRNIIQMTNNPLRGRSRVVGNLRFKGMLLLHNLDLFGTKHQAIIMMLLLVFITMEIQVCVFLFEFDCIMFNHYYDAYLCCMYYKLYIFVAQAYITMVTMESGILTIIKLSSISLIMIRMTKQPQNKLNHPRFLKILVLEK